MLGYLVVCLAIILFVIEYYVVGGYHYKGHRLLPLVLGLLALYHFYLIVEFEMGDVETFRVLKDLLLMQMFYLLFYYIMDFMRIKLHYLIHGVAFASLLLVDILVFTQVHHGDKYRSVMFGFVLVCVFWIFFLASWHLFKHSVSKQDIRTYTALYLCIMVPGVGVAATTLGLIAEQVIMPITLVFSCLQLLYLMRKGQLDDNTWTLKENLYAELGFETVLLDADLCFLDANDRARESFGNIIADMEKNPTDYRIREMVADWIVEGGDIEIPVGEDVYYQIRLQKISNTKGIQGYIVSCMNISKMKQEAELARQESKRKQNFLATMSHELRSPLHAILGGSEIILSGNGMTEKNRSMVLHIREAGENLLRLINAILDFSKLDEGVLILKDETYDFYELVLEQSRIHYSNLEGKDIEFRVELESDFPKEVMGDDFRVREIIQILLDSAARFTEHGYIVLRIGCERLAQELVRFRIQVEDTGAGIGEDELNTIFSKDLTYLDYHIQEGTGLRLAIVRQLVELMGGTAKAESDGEHGAKITVTILQKYPRQWKEAHVVMGNQLMLALQQWSNPVEVEWSYPTANVLVVDDMKVNREILQYMLKEWNILADLAEDGVMAIEMAKEKDYDLIFMDYMMPGISGIDAGMRIRGFWQGRLVLFSADKSEELRKKCLDKGFDDYMSKPITMEQLQRVLKEHLPSQKRIHLAQKDLKKIDNQKQEMNHGIERALKSFGVELEKLAELAEQKPVDYTLFRVKSHGIKGSGRMLDYTRIADAAEIMEMACKADHKTFIDNHIEVFADDLRRTAVDVKRRIQVLTSMEQEEKSGEDKKEVNKELLFAELLEGFRSYSIDSIEHALGELKYAVLSEQEQVAYDRAQKALDEFEYEDGIKALENL